MRILAFDCALETRSAALFEDESAIAGTVESDQRRHGERLVAMLDELMAGAGWGWPTLDLICLTRGPGSFTGLRIGLAAARGLALARELPLLGLTTLEALAASVDEPVAVLAAIDARRGQLYAQAFAADRTALCPPEVLAPSEIARLAPAPPLRLVGSGCALVLPHLAGPGIAAADAPAFPEAARFGRLARARAGEARRDQPPDPLYLRPPDARPRASRP